MACRLLALTLLSAEGLKDVHLVTKMAPYAIVSVSNNPRSKWRTSVDKDGGKNPTWNFHMTFFIPLDNPDGVVLHIQLKSKRTFGVSDVGEVHIRIKELLLKGTAKLDCRQVIKPSGEPEGILNISYQIALLQPPVTAYPAAVAGFNAYPPPAGAYPPPQPAYGYGAPPPQPQPGYGYPPQPQPQPQPNKNHFWTGLKALLLACDLGGDFIGQVISDAGDADGGLD